MFQEPVAAPVKPSREDVSAEVEAAKREAIAVVEEKASRLEGEVADLKRELQVGLGDSIPTKYLVGAPV